MKKSMGNPVWKAFILLFIMAVALSALFFWKQSAIAKPGIFCWDGEMLEQTQAQQMLQWLNQTGFGELYQYIPENAERSEVRSFAQGAANHQVSLYLLAGDPSWALESKSQRISQAVLRTALYNRELEKGAKFTGVMIDVEPYLLEEWDEESHREEILRTYLDALENGYHTAQAFGLRLVVCIPYYYDNLGFSEQLTRLISQCCDGVAIMNYNKSNELEQIQTECTIAKESRREVIVIYELQPVGSHGLTEKNTYYSDGKQGVLESWRALSRHLSAPRLRYAVHEYSAAKEVYEDE